METRGGGEQAAMPKVHGASDRTTTIREQDLECQAVYECSYGDLCNELVQICPGKYTVSEDMGNGIIADAVRQAMPHTFFR